METTVLIPIYNGLEYLEQALESIDQQTVQPLGGVVIAFNGMDKYVANEQMKRIKPRPNVRVFWAGDEGNKSQTLNDMIQNHVKTPYTCLLDSDDWWAPTKLEHQYHLIHQGYQVVGTQCVYACPSDPALHNKMPNIPLGDITNFDMFQVNPIINSSSLFQTNLGEWDSHDDLLFGMEDYDMWMRLRYMHHGKIRMYNCPEPLVYHRLHESSHFNNKNTNHHRLFQKWLPYR